MNYSFESIKFFNEGVRERLNEIDYYQTLKISAEKKELLHEEGKIWADILPKLKRIAEISVMLDGKKKAAKKATKVNRSAKSGKFVTDEFAKKNPDTTFKDTVKKGNGKRKLC